MNAAERLNLAAQTALIRDFRGEPGGLGFRCDADRQVVHLVIHDGEGHGSGVTLDAEAFAVTMHHFMRMEIDTLPMSYTREETPQLFARRLVRARRNES